MSGQVLGLITARGGSQRLPGKNLAALGDRSLLQWTIDAARASVIDRLILSSDDPRIIAAARAGGAEAPFVRPEALAGPAAGSLQVIRHAMAWVEAEAPGRHDILVLLQPTSPLRIAADIDAAVALVRQGATTAVSVCVPPKLDTLLLLEPGAPPRRLSELGRVRQVNGAVYAARWDHLEAGGALIDAATAFFDMPWRRSVDIDTAADLALARALLAETGDDAP